MRKKKKKNKKSTNLRYRFLISVSFTVRFANRTGIGGGPDRYQVAGNYRARALQEESEEIFGPEELPHGKAFPVTQKMISVVLMCGNDNVKVRFVFKTEPCTVRDGEPHERRCERIEAQFDNMLRLLGAFNGLDALGTYYERASELVDHNTAVFQVTFDMLQTMRNELQEMQAKAHSFCSKIQWLDKEPMRQEYLEFMETMREKTQGIINLERELSTKFVNITEETLHDIFKASDEAREMIKYLLLKRNELARTPWPGDLPRLTEGSARPPGALLPRSGRLPGALGLRADG